jgi:hypothetical protein
VKIAETYPFCVAVQPNSGPGRLSVKVSRSHTDTHPTGFLCTSDQPVAEAATYTTHDRQKTRTSVPSVGFEQAIPAIKLPLTYA